MELIEKISFEELFGKKFKVRVIEAVDNGKAVLTHYFLNHSNGLSEFYKKAAVAHLKKILEYKYSCEKIENKVAEKALQYLLFDFKKDIPFPPPKSYKFTFIDLFAGIRRF